MTINVEERMPKGVFVGIKHWLCNVGVTQEQNALIRLDNRLKDLSETGTANGDVRHSKPALNRHQSKSSRPSGLGTLCLHEAKNAMRLAKEMNEIPLNDILGRKISQPIRKLLFFTCLLSVRLKGMVDKGPCFFCSFVIL